MPLAKLAIKQPIFVIMVLLAITLVGVMSYRSMGVDLYPDMSSPVISVSVSFPGAGPRDVENLITKPVESAVSVLNGVTSTSSTSREGMSIVSVTFAPGFDLQQGAQQVREVLDSVSRRLPRDAGAPTLMRFDPNQFPFLTFAMAISGTQLSAGELNQLVTEVIQPRMERINGVASISASGIPVEQVMVRLNAQKMDSLRISPQQVISALQAENTIMPSGQLTNNNIGISMRTSSQFKDLDEINNLLVARKGNLPITLNQVADVTYETRKINSYVRVNGQNSYMLQVQKQSGSNMVQTASLVKEEIASISRDFPSLNFTVIQDDSVFIEQSDTDVTYTLILGALLAAAIVLVFFRNLRNTIITVVGLPIVVMATFAVISYMGFSRNIITLMALSLSIGLLIDDAIVVRENIFRHMENGESPKSAADKATGEIAFAVIAISLTLVAMFIPVAFTSGQIGRLFKEFGITVSVAVIISLLEAFTLAPLLSAYFAKPMKPHQLQPLENTRKGLRWIGNIWPSIKSGYRGLLGWCLNYRWVVIILTLAIFGVSMWYLLKMPLSYFPVTDSGQISIGVQMPAGTTIDTTDRLSQDVEKVVMAQPEVQRTYSRISSSSASISVLLKEGTPSDPVIQRLRDQTTQYRSSLIFSKPNQFMGIGMGGGGGANVRARPIVITLQGPSSLETLNGLADQVVTRLNSVPGVKDAATSMPPQQPELQILVDRQRADAAGISPVVVGTAVRTLFQTTTATQVDWNDRRTDVLVQLRDEDVSDAAVLLDLPITGTGGVIYPLSAVAYVDQGAGPSVLSRVDRQAQIAVGANLEGRSVGEVVPEIQKVMQDFTLPASITWKFGGQQAQTQSAFGLLIFAMVLGLIFVYMVLASQFGSFTHPFTVMTALPLAAAGSVVAMIATHTELTIVSMIGLILMMGMATKNSILLVDFIIHHRRQGQDRREAILNAGPIRLRPIIMTSMAVILGMIPTAMGMGAGGGFRAPMAIAVIGGVFSSTLLSLVAVPVFYTLIDDISNFFIWVFSFGRHGRSPRQANAANVSENPRQPKAQPALDNVMAKIEIDPNSPADD